MALRGGLIGCGFFAQNHLHAWQDAEGAAIVAICDRDAGRLAAAGDKFGIETRFADAETMLAEAELDFVDVATTMETHRELGELCASRGVPMICQKPFAPTVTDAQAIVNAFAGADLPLMVHENFRWQTPLKAVRRALDAGTIGKPFFARISWRTAYDVFANQPYLADVERLIILDLGIHLLDVARFFLGEVESVSAQVSRTRPGIRGEDSATMLLKLRGGPVVVVDCSYAAKREPDTFPETLVEIDGADGSIRLDPGFKLSVHGKGGTRQTYVGPRMLSWAEPPWHMVQESVLQAQQHWIECLQTGMTPSPSGADNLRTMALVDASYEAAASGRTVVLQL